MKRSPTARSLFIERLKREGKYEEWRRRYKKAKKDVTPSSVWTGLLVTKRNTSPTRVCLLCAAPVGWIRPICRGLVQGLLITDLLQHLDDSANGDDREGSSNYTSEHGPVWCGHRVGLKHGRQTNKATDDCKKIESKWQTIKQVHNTPPFLNTNWKTRV